ncbi:magnesium/cobalt efflux protein, partial [Candidatus Uhrbacteria bacterium]|nr:magnesium/cobalt efflux protein [Candidatus Uhrbacteria bacterium]
DLLEELVGEISDESDIDENRIKRIDKVTIVAHGDTDIKDVNRFFNVKIEAETNRTLGGAIMEKLGALPKPGETVLLGENLSATVEEMADRRATKIKLVKKTDSSKPA